MGEADPVAAESVTPERRGARHQVVRMAPRNAGALVDPAIHPGSPPVPTPAVGFLEEGVARLLKSLSG